MSAQLTRSFDSNCNVQVTYQEFPKLNGIGIGLEFYLFDRQLHNIGKIISKKMCEIILSGDSHKGTNWPLA